MKKLIQLTKYDSCFFISIYRYFCEKNSQMQIKTKSFLYQLLSFVIVFLPFRIMLDKFTSLEGILPSIISFVITLILAPKFQVVKTNQGEKLFMKWIFKKGVQEL